MSCLRRLEQAAPAVRPASLFSGPPATVSIPGWPLLLVGLAVVAIGCIPPVDDDDDDDGEKFEGEPLTWIFSEGFEASDGMFAEAVEAAGADVFALLDADAEDLDDRSAIPPEFSQEDVDSVANPGLPASDLVGVMVAARSAHTMADHRQLVLLSDRTVIEPSCEEHYERSFPDGGAGCWESEDCDSIRASDDFEAASALGEVSGRYEVDVRAIVLPGGLRALVERSWLPESALDDNGAWGSLQEYRLAIVIEGGGDPRRIGVIWIDEAMDVSEELVQNFARRAIDDGFEAEEDYLAGL